MIHIFKDEGNDCDIQKNPITISTEVDPDYQDTDETEETVIQAPEDDNDNG